jgi:hypothetical protein
VCLKQTFTIKSASKSSTSFFPTSMFPRRRLILPSQGIFRFSGKKKKERKEKKKRECLFLQCSMPSVFSGLFVI